MTAKIDPEIRAKALEIYATHGPGEASRQTGVKRATISMWALRDGVTVTRSTNVRAATEAAKATMEQRRIQLADDLLTDAARLRDQLWQPSQVHHWGQETIMDERTGRAAASVPKFATATIDQPVYGDQKQIMLAAAIAIDKSQLLSGEATSRTEHLEPAEAEGEIQRMQAEWRERQAKKAS